MPIPTRIVPRFNNMLNAERRARSVDTSASGEFEPSTVRKIGAVPRVALNSRRVSAAEIVQPSPSLWQLPQLRPLVPRSSKNALCRSMLPATLKVVDDPNASRSGKLFGSRQWACDAAALATVSAASEFAGLELSSAARKGCSAAGSTSSGPVHAEMNMARTKQHLIVMGPPLRDRHHRAQGFRRS